MQNTTSSFAFSQCLQQFTFHQNSQIYSEHKIAAKYNYFISATNFFMQVYSAVESSEQYKQHVIRNLPSVYHV